MTTHLKFYKSNRLPTTGKSIFGLGEGVLRDRPGVSRLTIEAIKDIMKQSREGVVKYW